MFVRQPHVVDPRKGELAVLSMHRPTPMRPRTLTSGSAPSSPLAALTPRTKRTNKPKTQPPGKHGHDGRKGEASSSAYASPTGSRGSTPIPDSQRLFDDFLDDATFREETWVALIPIGRNGGESLRGAAARGDLLACTTLIRSGASIHAFDEAFERTPLHHAARHGHADVIKFLVQKGANVDAVDISRYTPLHLACEHGHTHAVEALCRCGAALLARSSNGSAPLHLACEGHHVEAVARLLDHMRDNGLFNDELGKDEGFPNDEIRWLIDRAGESSRTTIADLLSGVFARHDG